MHGRAALRMNLLHLRHLLGKDAGEGAPPHLLIKHDTLGLNLTSALEIDLVILEEAWMLAHASTRTALTMPESERHDLLERLQRAASLPRGEFLEGFSLRDAPAFDDWVRFQHKYWHLHTNEIFDQLSYLPFEASELGGMLPASEIEHLYTHLGRRAVGEGPGDVYLDACLRTRCTPAGDGERRPEPPGDPDCVVVL